MIPWGFRRKNKYGAKPVKDAGQHFDSTGEFKRWCELKLLQKAGEIGQLTRQERFRLEVNGTHICDYIADFCYWDTGLLSGISGKKIVEDYKSPATMTPIFAIKRKLMLACHGIEVRITGTGQTHAPEPAQVKAARETA